MTVSEEDFVYLAPRNAKGTPFLYFFRNAAPGKNSAGTAGGTPLLTNLRNARWSAAPIFTHERRGSGVPKISVTLKA